MNKQVKNTRNLVQLVMAVFVVGVCSVAQAQIVVNLNVSANEDKLEITTRGSCSRAPNGNGCIRASGQTNINYNLTGSTACSKAGGANWELQDVFLGGKNSTSKPGSFGNIDDEVAWDFNADRTTGVVIPVSKNAKHILIKDRNTNKYDIWYKVIANCVAPNGVSMGAIESDPRIENDGGGSN